MILIDHRSNSNPYLNLAMEEYVVRHLKPGAEDMLMLYINTPAVVVGKNQSIYKEVNFGAMHSDDVDLCRRVSGGGTVYHDKGNLCFAFFSAFDESKLNNYRYFNQPIIEVLHKLGIAAEMDERNNILYHGKKISGNAQFTNRQVILSHGTLLFDANMTLLRQCLQPNPFEVSSKAVSSVRSEVTNLKPHLPEFTTAEEWRNYLAKELPISSTYSFSPKEWRAIEDLAKKTYSSPEWIYGRSPKTVIRKEGVEIVVEDGKILEIKSKKKDLSFLVGAEYHVKALKKAIEHSSYANKAALLHEVFAVPFKEF